jgi:hypothetical protein
MWDMFTNALKLFLRGKLFRDPRLVLRQWLIGVAVAAVLLIGLALAGAPLWLAMVVASAVSGLLQPYLFKNLKYN